MPTTTRFGNLGAVFKEGEAEFLNLIACLSVIYEDLRIEINGTKAGEAPLGDLDKIG
jgi:hypothetical protein